MGASRLEALRRRLDALAGPAPRRRGLRAWAWRKWEGESRAVTLPLLEGLDRDLDRVGVLTLADARLLHRLGVRRGRAAALATHLAARADAALAEYEPELRWAEQAWRAGALPPGVRSALERGYLRLSRVLRVAQVFSQPPSLEPGPLGLLPRVAAGWQDVPPRSAVLAAAEFLSERARGTPLELEQKRRDLDTAHALLLQLGTQRERERARGLRWEVAQARERLAPAPPVRSLAALLREVRGAASSDPARAWGLLRGLYERALEAGDEPLAEAARTALGSLLPEPELLAGLVERAEWEGLGAWDEAREALVDVAIGWAPERLALLQLAAGSARFFDVEEPSAAEHALAAGPRGGLRRVPYPTPQLGFETTGQPADAPSFVIQDPRRVLMDLAAHAQPVRAYYEEAPRPSPRRRSAVRVYVCDASGSMQGGRARLRDALLLAELAALRERAARGLPFAPLLFEFFRDAPGALQRVDSAQEATRQMEALFAHSPAEGQTNITAALVGAFEAVREAQAVDPRLAQATLVLVTDGEDRVDLERLRRARAPTGHLDIALSFVSLGQENPDLRALVLEQRGAGGRAFYHHLTDADLAWAGEALASPWRTLLPRDVEVTPGALEQLLPHLEALEALAEQRPPPGPVSVEASFGALFPAPARAAAPPSSPHAARVADLLSAVAEVAALTPPQHRAREGQALLRHLLGVYGLSAAQYGEALEGGEPAVVEALERVRLLCAPLE